MEIYYWSKNRASLKDTHDNRRICLIAISISLRFIVLPYLEVHLHENCILEDWKQTFGNGFQSAQYGYYSKIKMDINHLPPCRSKPVKLSSSLEHNLRYFGWKSGGLWLSHWLPSKEHCQGPEKYEIRRQNSWTRRSTSCHCTPLICNIPFWLLVYMLLVVKQKLDAFEFDRKENYTLQDCFLRLKFLSY